MKNTIPFFQNTNNKCFTLITKNILLSLIRTSFQISFYFQNFTKIQRVDCKNINDVPIWERCQKKD